MTLARERIAFSPDQPGTPDDRARSRRRIDGREVSDRPILVVDDDPEILAMLRDLLESEGLAVRTASNGAVDMRMPILDGWGFAQRFHERHFGYPIVVMTAAESARRWAEEIGATAYIAKPFDVDELLQTIERHRQRDSKPN